MPSVKLSETASYTKASTDFTLVLLVGKVELCDNSARNPFAACSCQISSISVPKIVAPSVGDNSTGLGTGTSSVVNVTRSDIACMSPFAAFTRA